MARTIINLHGALGKEVGKKEYKLKVDSVGDALNAIETQSNRKLFKFLSESEKSGLKYRVLINGRDFLCEKTPTVEDPESIRNSELCMPIKDLKTIDIVPVVEGAEDVLTIIAGVILVVVGIILWATGPLGASLVVAGLGLIAAGVVNLLSKPPKFEDFSEIRGGAGNRSYLFNGPVNSTQEGGPVFVGYGRLIVGSHVIASSYEPGIRETADGLTT
jgi:predicted phage tail protein